MAEPFSRGGPRLPIEFSRVSLDGRATLVIDPSAPDVETYWAPLAVSSLEEAVEGLGVREMIPPERRPEWVGLQARRDRSLDSGIVPPGLRERIASWLEAQALDAVVWTALPGRSPSGALEYPDFDLLLGHLRSLSGAARDRAEQYVRRTPPLVRTPRRERFEALLGWLPTEAKIEAEE